MQAASKALKEREAALLTLHAIEADLEKRRHTIVAIEEEGQKVCLLFCFPDPTFVDAVSEDAVLLRLYTSMGIKNWLT